MATDGRKRALAQAAFNELPDPRSYNYNDLLLATAHSGVRTDENTLYLYFYHTYLSSLLNMLKVAL